MYHSRSYHRFFEGYTEKGIVDASGNYKIIRVYTGDYYEAQLSKGQQKKYKRSACLLYGAGVILYLAAGIQPSGINRLSPVAFLEGVLLILIFLLARSMFYLMTEKGPYTIRKYRIISENTKKYAKGAALCSWIIAGMAVGGYIFWLIGGKAELDLSSLICIVGFAACGAVWYRIFSMEKRIVYEKRENHQVRPEKGVDILY